MKHGWKIAIKTVCVLGIACIIFVGYLFVNNDIGIPESKIVSDIRSSQKISADWVTEGCTSETMAAYISYPADRSDCTFSVYLNRPGLSFGYFFRLGGNLLPEDIKEFSLEGYDERAFISMNQQKVERLEINNGVSVQTISIDSSKPFALVLPENSGILTFYDANGNIIEF